VFVVGNAMLRKQTYGNYPAQLNIMKAVYEGTQVPFDAALRIETRYFIKTLMTPQAKGMIRTLFLSKQELGKGAGRPAGVPHYDVKKVAVIGAGMMGAGIAYVQAMAGIETVLIDQTQEAADKGKAYAEEPGQEGRLARQDDGREGRRPPRPDHPTTDYALIKGSDLVVEAVFENREIKADVTKRPRPNWPTPPSSAPTPRPCRSPAWPKASVRPRFIGIHFFSPVDKMGLVEIIMGEATSGQEALAKSIDYVLKIKKTPIVVNDSRGFYTSRCFGTFVQEGMEMLAEGSPRPSSTMSAAPPACRAVRWRCTTTSRWTSPTRSPSRPRRTSATSTKSARSRGAREDGRGLGRYGRKNGKGFYDYPEGGPPRPCGRPGRPGPVTITEVDKALRLEEIRTRLLYRQAVEAARCFEEGVIDDPREADVGAILGWGFAPWTGGPISLIDGIGLAKFVEGCDALAQKYGDALRAAAAAARHGRQGRDLLQPLRRQDEGRRLGRRLKLESLKGPAATPGPFHFSLETFGSWFSRTASLSEEPDRMA
jgi:3-hydroxyacyl-CoA dehydrogenase/enoyl-CoA hydratase/3-hydroxybutyryl-CoA epimerase